ncbi:MAG: hypothetical protein AB1Z98_29300 [Nannocystaceae bacterium]
MNLFAMTTRGRPLVGAALYSLLLPGCFTAQLDPALPGVFACTQRDDDCPSGLRCVNRLCEDEDAVPSLAVTNPEDEQLFITDAPDGPLGPPAAPLMLEVLVTGDLTLVSANSGADHEFGEGHVIVTVDGQQAALIDSGSIETPRPVMVEVDNVPGPHRITTRAIRNDGVPYDNDEAVGARLFWIESELALGMRPFVAVKTPWPGSTFPLSDAPVEVEIATLNFDMLPPGQGRSEGQGHAHVYYDTRIGECVDDPACDGTYLAVVGNPPVTTFELPQSGARSVELGVALRHVGHDLYRIPFDCDPIIDLDLCRPVVESITINRADD